LPLRYQPPRGTWVLCGYGRFGKAVHRYLDFEGVETVIIEKELEMTKAPKGAIHGRGTEAVTLREAHIEKAVGIVAGTDDDEIVAHDRRLPSVASAVKACSARINCLVNAGGPERA